MCLIWKSLYGCLYCQDSELPSKVIRVEYKQVCSMAYRFLVEGCCSPCCSVRKHILRVRTDFFFFFFLLKPPNTLSMAGNSRNQYWWICFISWGVTWRGKRCAQNVVPVKVLLAFQSDVLDIAGMSQPSLRKITATGSYAILLYNWNM